MKKQESKRKNGLFHYDGSFYTVTGKIYDLAAISVCWLIGCIPLVTIGASCSAMYAAVIKVIRGDQGRAMLQFWQAYRRDLKSSIPITLIFGAALLLLVLNIGIVQNNTSGTMGLFLLMLYGNSLLYLLTAACYVFPLLSRFEMPFGWQIKMALYMAVRHLPKSILLLALFAVCCYLIFRILVLALIVPAAGTLVASYLLEPLLARHMPKDDADEEDAAE